MKTLYNAYETLSMKGFHLKVNLYVFKGRSTVKLPYHCSTFVCDKLSLHVVLVDSLTLRSMQWLRNESCLLAQVQAV